MPSYTLRGVEVDFPFDAYPCQLDYMSRVLEALQEGRNALLESPTGTGKTLCLLCATLAWRESVAARAAAAPAAVAAAAPHASELVQGLRQAYAELKAEKAARGDGLPTIIYSSRTHSQLKQVMGELAATAYAPRVAVLGSRQQSCMHPSVQQLPAAAANQACRGLVARRACKWHSNVERYMKANPDAGAAVMDIEDLSKLGSSRTLCPYYLSREMAATADVVFMPYNYLVDAKTRGGLGITWDNAVLIFDEAHNVEGVCSDAASFDVPAAVLAGAIEEVGTAAELASALAERGAGNVADEFGKMTDGSNYLKEAISLRQLQMVLRKLEREIAALQVSPDRGLTRPGAFLFDLLAKINLTATTWPEMSHLMEEATGFLTADALEGGRRHGARASAYRLHALHDALALAFSTLEPLKEGSPAPHTFYRVHAHLEEPRGGGPALPTLGYWCFSPGLAMAALTEMKVRCMLLTSGTLSPLGSFAQELAVPFPVRLENPHVIDPAQVWVSVVGQGPAGHALNSSYASRQRPEYKEDLGNAVVNFARIVPDGLLVFFPSYGLMKQCMDAWRTPGPRGGSSLWDRIAQHKAPVVEPREAAQFPAAAADFRAKLDNPVFRGAAFFAVCRGKASEGLDFSDRAGRAVIITGIPYATRTDPKVIIKQDVLNEARRARAAGGKRPHGGAAAATAPADESLTGDAWYSQQAVRAVNQAMGRVIRHRRDYGAIILCDERFRQPNVRAQLSRWLRDRVDVQPNFGSSAASLTRFFKAQAEAERAGLVGEAGQRPVRGAAAPAAAAALGGPGGGGSAIGAFQVAARPRQAPSGGQQPLMRAVPAAADVAGLAQLLPAEASSGREKPESFLDRFDPVVGSVPTGSLDAMMMELGSERPARAAAAAAAATATAPRPWERAAAAPFGAAASLASLGPGSSRLRVPGAGRALATAAAAVGAAPDAPATNMVGPAHRIQAHKDARKDSRHVERQQLREERERRGEEVRARMAAAEEQRRLAAAEEEAERLRAQQREAEAEVERQAALQPPPQQQQQQEAPPAPPGGGLFGGPAPRPGPIIPGLSSTGAAKAQSQPNLMDRLKKELPPECSHGVIAAVRQYGVNRDPAPLLAAAAAALHPPERRALLGAFRAFVPAKLRGQFDVQVTRAASAATALRGAGGRPPPPLPQPAAPPRKLLPGAAPWQAPPPRSRPGPSAPSAAAAPPRRAAPKPVAPKPAAGPPCGVCKKSPAEAPHVATCCKTLIACYSCWLTAVALRTCPGCKKPLKRAMLQKKYFA